MKKLLLFSFMSASTFALHAQSLSADQNPRYKESMDKYAAQQSNLQTTMNTTVQDTYKAYDWSTAKAERRADRISYRREARLYNNYFGYDNNYNYNYNNDYYYNRYSRPYPSYYNSPYSNRYRYYGRRHW